MYRLDPTSILRRSYVDPTSILLRSDLHRAYVYLHSTQVHRQYTNTKTPEEPHCCYHPVRLYKGLLTPTLAIELRVTF
jgi:hypothetical protein